MTCVRPITAWKKKWSSLIDPPEKYYNDKKLKFHDPKNPKDYEQIKIACGNCIGCRLDHANAWATRIQIETENHKENCFITLTYDNKNVPRTTNKHLTLRKKDVQDFIKRLRFELSKDNIKISYFLCGEYGTNTFRPHYHLCLFGWKPQDLEQLRPSLTKKTMFTSKKVEKIWGNGFIVVQELNYNTASYAARYVQKKAGIKPNKRIYSNKPPELVTKIDERTKKPFTVWKTKRITEKTDIYGREKEFILMSKKPAIGLNYWFKNKNKIINNEGILLKINENVKLKPIPRYFKKVWEKEDMLNHDRFKYNQKVKAEKNYQDKLNKIEGTNKEQTLLQTIKNNLTFKAKFLKREQN